MRFRKIIPASLFLGIITVLTGGIFMMGLQEMPSALADNIGYYGICHDNNRCPSDGSGLGVTMSFNRTTMATDVQVASQQQYGSSPFSFQSCSANTNTGQSPVISYSSDKKTCTFSVPASWNSNSVTIKGVWHQGWGSGAWDSYSKCTHQNHCNNRSETFTIPKPDLTPPSFITGYTFLINGGAASTTNLGVTLSPITATDNVGVTACQVSNNNVNWTTVACNTTVNWTLASGISGTRTVWARACDAESQCSIPANDSIEYIADFMSYPASVQGNLYHASQPTKVYPLWPANYVFQINNGAISSSSSSVTLDTIQAVDMSSVSYCSASNDGTNWTNVPCGQDNIPWTLSSTETARKTVYARACTADNLCAIIGDNINLGSTSLDLPPVITHMTIMPTTVTIGAQPGFTATPGVVLKAYVNDNQVSGCDIDSGSGFGTDFTATGTSGCGNIGYKTLSLSNLTTPNSGTNPLTNFTLRAWDQNGMEARVTMPITYDTESPTASYSGYDGGLLSAPFVGEVVMHCTDNIVCDRIEYYVGTFFNTSVDRCDDFDDRVIWQTCNTDSGSCSRNLTVGDNEALCVKVTDKAGRVGYSERVQTHTDTIPPSFPVVHMYKDEDTTSAAILPQDGTYYLRTGTPVVYFEASDANPTWGGDSMGVCDIRIDGEPVAGAACSLQGSDQLSSFRLMEPIPEGNHLLTITLRDQVDNEGTLSLPVFVDSTAPDYNLGDNREEIEVSTNDLLRSITTTLPSLVSDGEGSGIGSIQISFTRQGSPEVPFEMMNVQEANSNMSQEGNTLIIRPNTTSGGTTFPAGITVWGFAPLSSEGTQYLYDVRINAFDKAGNPLIERADARLTRTGISFDTLAPSIGAISRPGMSTSRFGDGLSQETPYRVGGEQSLALRIPLTEYTNNFKNTVTVPVNIRQVEGRTGGTGLLSAGTIYAYNTYINLLDSITDSIFGGGDPSAAGSTGCKEVNTSRECDAFVSFSIPENFVGSVDFKASDGAANSTPSARFWVKQDSRRPQLLPGFTLTANIAPGEHYKGTLYRFTATGLDPNGEDKELTAFISYMQEGQTEETIRQTGVSAGTTANQFTFDAQLENIAYGEQTIRIYFEDNYGNRHDGSAIGGGDTVDYLVYHDNVAPDVTGFRYGWNDNDITVAFDTVTEDSFPLTIQIQTSSNGTDWSNRDPVITKENGTDAANTVFTVEDVTDTEEIRVLFGDTVKDYQSGEVVNGSNPRTDYLVRDIVLTVTEQGERLRISYTPENGVNTEAFASYTVTYTGPHGRTGSFPAITAFAAEGGNVGLIDTPLQGAYIFNFVLQYNDDRPALEGTKTYNQTTDIVTPRAVVTLPLITDYITFNEELGRYYVRTSTPELAFNYTITPEFTGAATVYDDSLPLTLTIEGAEESITMPITPVGSGTFTGTAVIELLQERTYTLLSTVSDGAGRSVSFPFTIVKDRSIPSFTTTLNDAVTAEPLTIESRAGTGVLLTAKDEALLDIVVFNEVEPVTTTVDGGALVLTPLGTIPDAEPDTQTFRYRISNLQEGAPQNISVTVRDRAGSSRTTIVTLQRDASAPRLVNGTVNFNGTAFAENPVGISAVFEDLSRVDYIVSLNGIQQTRYPYTGAIRLPEGTSSGISIVFLDELDNATSPFIITDTIFVDTQRPEAAVQFEPNAERTNEAMMHISFSEVQDAGPHIDWAVTRNGSETASGRLLQEDFTSLPEHIAMIDMLPNTANTFRVTVRDSVGNSMSTESMSIIHDNLPPEVSFSPAERSDSLLWNFTVTDDAGIGSVGARVRNISNGMTVAVPSLTGTNGEYTFTSGSLPLTPGQRFVLDIDAGDTLGNTSTYSSEVITIEDTSNGTDPNLVPINIPENITGDRLTVTVSNGRNIHYVAEDMPRGEYLYLVDVLALGKNTIDNRTLRKFPIGYYNITITDNLENQAVIPNYLVTPYYFDAEADVDGNEFGGGITDEKLVKQAEESGSIYTAETMRILQEIKTVIESNIVRRINLFLSDGVRS